MSASPIDSPPANAPIRRGPLPVPVEERFWHRVAIQGESECWLWHGRVDKDGYGRIAGSGTGSAELGAHRVAYELLIGPIPDGLTIDHLCRVTRCVNPRHMEPVTFAENTRRQRGSTLTHCSKGHEFTPENTRMRRRGADKECRRCLTCERARDKARRANPRTVGRPDTT